MIIVIIMIIIIMINMIIIIIMIIMIINNKGSSNDDTGGNQLFYRKSNTLCHQLRMFLQCLSFLSLELLIMWLMVVTIGRLQLLSGFEKVYYISFLSPFCISQSFSCFGTEVATKPQYPILLLVISLTLAFDVFRRLERPISLSTCLDNINSLWWPLFTGEPIACFKALVSKIDGIRNWVQSCSLLVYIDSVTGLIKTGQY